MKVLEEGKFYSFRKHPAYIHRADVVKNLYLVIKTGTTKNRHNTPLLHSTEKRVKRSYVDKIPYLGCRKHFGSRELIGMKFHEDDMHLIDQIAKRKPCKLK